MCCCDCGLKKETRGQELFDQVCQSLDLLERDCFGLRYVDTEKQRVWFSMLVNWTFDDYELPSTKHSLLLHIVFFEWWHCCYVFCYAESCILLLSWKNFYIDTLYMIDDWNHFYILPVLLYLAIWCAHCLMFLNLCKVELIRHKSVLEDCNSYF